MLASKIYKISKILFSYSGYIRKNLKSKYQDVFLKKIGKGFDQLNEKEKIHLEEIIKKTLDDIEIKIDEISKDYKQKTDINSWISKLIKDDKISFPEDIEKLKELLNNYYNFAIKSSNFNGSKNILDYEDDSVLYETITNFFEKERKQNKKYNLEDQDIFLKEGEYLCFRTNNFALSYPIISDTNWCIGRSLKFFEKYLENDYYYVIMKGGLPYCCINFLAGECRKRDDGIFNKIDDNFYNFVERLAKMAGKEQYDIFSGRKKITSTYSTECFDCFILHNLNQEKIKKMKEEEYETYPRLLKNGDFYVENDVDYLMKNGKFDFVIRLLKKNKIEDKNKIDKIVEFLCKSYDWFYELLKVESLKSNKVLLKHIENLAKNENDSEILKNVMLDIQLEKDIKEKIINELFKNKRGKILATLMLENKIINEEKEKIKILELCNEQKEYYYVLKIMIKLQMPINKEYETAFYNFLKDPNMFAIQEVLKNNPNDKIFEMLFDFFDKNKSKIEWIVEIIRYLYGEKKTIQRLLKFLADRDAILALKALDYETESDDLLNLIFDELYKNKNFEGISFLLSVFNYKNKEKIKKVINDVFNYQLENNFKNFMNFFIRNKEFFKYLDEDIVFKTIKYFAKLHPTQIFSFVNSLTKNQKLSDYTLEMIFNFNKNINESIKEFVDIFKGFVSEDQVDAMVNYAIKRHDVKLLMFLDEKNLIKNKKTAEKAFYFGLSLNEEMGFLLCELLEDYIDPKIKEKYQKTYTLDL